LTVTALPLTDFRQIPNRYDHSQMAPSPPRTTTSITPIDGDVAAGDEVKPPPRNPHADHPDPTVYDV
jgi:hypothetical protein